MGATLDGELWHGLRRIPDPSGQWNCPVTDFYCVLLWLSVRSLPMKRRLILLRTSVALSLISLVSGCVPALRKAMAASPPSRPRHQSGDDQTRAACQLLMSGADGPRRLTPPDCPDPRRDAGDELQCADPEPAGSASALRERGLSGGAACPSRRIRPRIAWSISTIWRTGCRRIWRRWRSPVPLR